MIDPPHDPLEDQLPLLAARADEALAAGRPRAGLTTMIAPLELRPRIDKALACVELLRQFWNVESPARPDLDSAGALPWRELGRFEIRAELGRGGFGVVYLAYDPRLEREVALKVPRFDFVADPGLRQRFQHEARAAAGLDHPNIVQIFETGEVGPVCYIASAYCPGVTLATWLHDRTEPVPVTDAARLIATLADAVQHAHERGLLHRDLKPGNILLQKDEGKSSQSEFILHPSSLILPKITDFGLAKFIATRDGEAPAVETQHGAIIGTPQYMAPEQAEAKAGLVGPATDVYALGAMLYELLTSRPPFQGDSVLEVLVQVKSVEPLSPGKLRPRLARDLETICLKCLEKDPRRRYASAAKLAIDLRHYLANEPILARPISLPERCVKWMRRHPALAGMAAVTIVVALAGLSGIIWQWRRAEVEATNAKAERDTAIQERANAEENFRKAKEVVDQLTRVGRNLADQPGMHKTAQTLLEQSLGFYKEFLAKKSSDPTIRLETARAYYRVAEIYSSLQKLEDAELALAEAIVLLDGLIVEFPERELYLDEKARDHLEQGDRLRHQKKIPRAEAAFSQAISCLRELLRRSPENPHYKNSLAWSLLNRCSLRLGSTAELEEAMAEAIRLEEEIAAAVPGDAYFRFQLALAYDDHGMLLMERDQKASARQECERALAIRQSLYDSQPKSVQFRQYLARSFNNMAQLHLQTGDRGQALDSSRKAAEYYSSVVNEFPDYPVYRRGLVDILHSQVALLQTPAQWPEKEALHRNIIAQYARLAKDVPAEPDFVSMQGAHQFLLARLLRQTKREAEAEEHIRAGLALHLKLVAQYPESPLYQQSAWRDANELLSWLSGERRFKEVEVLLRRCVNGMPGNANANNNLAWLLVACEDPSYHDPAAALPLAKAAQAASPKDANIWNTVGIVYYRLGEDREAVRTLNEAMRLGAGGRPLDWLFLAMAHWQLNETTEAIAFYDRSVDWMSKNNSTDAELTRFRAEAGALLGKK